MADSIRIKRGVKADLPKALPLGELAYCTDTRQLFIGTGNSIAPVKAEEIHFDDLNERVDELGSRVSNHNHDDRYYTEEEINSKINTINNNINQKSVTNFIANSDFRINPYGYKSYTSDNGEIKTVDSWILAKGNKKGLLTVLDNGGIQLSDFDQEDKFLYIRQEYRKELGNFQKLLGKTITFSVKLKLENATTGGIFVQAYIFTNGNEIDKNVITNYKEINNNGFVTKSLTFEVPTTATQINFGVGTYDLEGNGKYGGCLNKEAILTVENAKVEIGSVATPFTPRLYSEELLNSNNGVIGSNPNLLINGDFQVWQRGTSFHQETMTYCADRWLIAGENTHPKVEKTNNGVKITSTRNGGWTNFLTRLENATLKKLIGKTLTYTIKLKVPTKISQVWCLTNSPSGLIYHHEKGFSDKNYEYLTGSFVVKSTELNDNSYLEFGIQGIPEANNSFEIEYAKLELGSVATPFVPRPYAEELALCRRYYQNGRFRGSGNIYSAAGYILVPLEQKMRIVPTTTVNSVGKLATHNGLVTPTDIRIAGLEETGVTLQYTHNKSDILSNSPVFWDNGNITLDAEIY